LNNKKSNFIVIGEIVGAHGLNGELKVILYNKDSDILDKKLDIFFLLNEKFTRFKLESVKQHSKYKLFKLDNCNSISEIELLIKNKFIFLLRKTLPQLDSGSFYLVDLIGCSVQDMNKNIIGSVVDIVSLPTNNSMLVNSLNKREILIPILDNFIELFDFDNKKVIINKDAEGFLV